MRCEPFYHPTFSDHALLDSGDGEKLERFGQVVLRRPDPQALWRRQLEDARWRAADLTFVRESDRGGRWVPREGAAAELRRSQPEWDCRYGDAVLRVRPTAFKHVGVFPEQASNWEFVRALRGSFTGERPRLLNLFGYSGAASVLAAQAGFAVTHVDASKASIAWTRDNAAASGLPDDGMRIICDDALAFTRREVRRASRYDVVLLDPPHYGRGPKGEKWQFETGIVPLLEAVRDLLDERACVILSTYAIGFTPLALRNLLGMFEGGKSDIGELALCEEGQDGRYLPAGLCARWWRGLEVPRS
ncbi:MAG: 23S rRNA (cytosine1962-C5)-methyltransferase [Chlamydiales bacterium]